METGMNIQKIITAFSAMLPGMLFHGSCPARDGIPFEDALKEANVTVSGMRDGQRHGLMVGNGDLYGIVFERDNDLIAIHARQNGYRRTLSVMVSRGTERSQYARTWTNR